MRFAGFGLIALLCGVVFASAPAKERLLKDVEGKQDVKFWEKPKGTLEVVGDSLLKGKASAKVTPGTYLVMFRRTGIPGDWSGYDALAIDFNNTTGKAQRLYILVGDKDWQQKKGGTYWNRHNSTHSLPPGKHTFKLPITGLYRGEAGSRYNDIKHPIVPKDILRLDLGIGKKGEKGAIYLDNFRLLSERVPPFIKAFDFGPPEQNLQMGFTGVSWNTVYTKAKGHGLEAKLGHSNRARDDTFPTVLYKDWVNMAEGWKDWGFKVDVPNGKYHVFTVFSDCGYWGGEAIRHTKRHIKAEGKIAWSEDLGEQGNYWKPNYLFEHVEPLIGQDFWSLYMEKIFEPKRFTVDVADGQLNLQWHTDKPWSAKVNCVIVYPDTKKKEGDAFCDEIVKKQRDEFSVAASEHKPASGGTLDALPKTEKDKGYVFFLTDYERETYQTTIPRPEQIRREKKISAARRESEPITFAVRPLKDLGKATVAVSDFKGPSGILEKDLFEVTVVRHLSRRGFGAINYRIIPQMLKSFDTVELPAEITREFFVIARVPETAKPGTYAGTIRLRSDKGLDESLKVSVSVHPFTLDESEFLFCFFGTIPDIKVARFLRRAGFNSFSGGKRIGLSGFEKDGTPKLDFTGMDTYMKMLKEAGYTQEGWGYGGGTIQHIGYTKDTGFFGKWEKSTGLSYDALLKKVFDRYKQHIDTNQWLPIVYGLVDETRNVDVARQQVAQQKAINKAAPWLKTGGSYSVTYGKGRNPKDYHQWIFESLRVSSLNRHDDAVMKMAKELGKQVYIYNQGQSRYSFGAYQWSEFRKGVHGRQQWHLHIQHGFQFFDLDGREPDTGVLYYGVEGPIPTLAFVRCAEGADDFYYLQTLYNRIETMKKKGASAQAIQKAGAVLREIESKIKINERKKPQWLDNDELRRRCATAIQELDAVAGGK